MKSFSKDYLVNELARFYGISPDAVRLYDKKGILVPYKNDTNHYRFYNREAVITMDYIMRLKKMGFSLEEICKIVNDITTGETVDVLQSQEDEIESKIREMCLLKEMTADFRESVNSIIENEGKILVREAPAFICRKISETAQETIDSFAKLKIGAFPIFTFHISGKSFLDEDYFRFLSERTNRTNYAELYVSVTDKKGINERPGFPSQEFQVVPAGKSLYFAGRIMTNGDYSGAVKLVDYIKEKGIQIKREPLVRLIFIQKNKTNSTDFYEYWVPIE